MIAKMLRVTSGLPHGLACGSGRRYGREAESGGDEVVLWERHRNSGRREVSPEENGMRREKRPVI